MFKPTISMNIALYTGSLTLLALVSLLVMSNTVLTSDITPRPEHLQARISEQSAFASSDPINPATSTPSNDNESIKTNHKPSPSIADNRRRNARVYGSHQSSSSGYGSQSTLDSYASAYAAANSPGTQSDQQNLVQTSVQANDALAYSSFGESSPSSGGSSSSSTGSEARQLGSAAEYTPHSNYYASYMSPSSNEASYSGHQSNLNHYGPSSHHQYQQSYYKNPLTVSYPSSYDRHSATSYYDRSHAASASSPFFGSNFGAGHGLMSSASAALSHWTNGFTISEIVCTIVAIAIGAIILGAPFFLIYLALMGNFSGSGTLSLTNPTQGSSTTGGQTSPTNGRRKRLAIFEQMNSDSDQKHASEFVAFADSIASQLSPFMDIQQLSNSFKRLINSIEKYSTPKREKHDAKMM